jgi:hypothetical protein
MSNYIDQIADDLDQRQAVDPSDSDLIAQWLISARSNMDLYQLADGLVDSGMTYESFIAAYEAGNK